MVSGLAGADLQNACIAKLEVDPAQVKAVVAEARKRLTLAAEYNRDELLGTALTRLNDLYSRCIRSQNEAKALHVQREINRLTGLYDEPPPADIDADGETAADGEMVGEMEAVGEHLFALELTTRAYPLREHARLAAQRIRELEARIAEAAGPNRRKESMVTLYTLGYTGWAVDDVVAALDRLNAVLVDVRISPRSRNPAYSGKRLRERLGDRYVHVRVEPE